jgi:predicted metal-dependent phosphoesterase TrpH
MIDLHLHTHYSDGTLSPRDLVHLSKSNGIRTIAITDHDGVSGISEGLKTGTELGVKVIPGIEFSTTDDEGVYMHILGFGINIYNSELKNELEDIRKKRKARNKKLLQALNDMGCHITIEDLQLRKGQEFVGKPIFAMALAKKGYISTPLEAFAEDRYLRSDAIRRIHREKIHVGKAIKLIHNAGGVSALAHPMKISRLGDKTTEDYFIQLNKVVSRLKPLGLDGIECYYSSHTLTQTRKLCEIAEKKQLLISAGSDFHGPEFSDNLSVGTFLKDKEYDRIMKEKGIHHYITKNL